MTIGDGPVHIDPLLIHPIVRSLCCCQNFVESTEAKSDGEDVAKMLNKLVDFVHMSNVFVRLESSKIYLEIILPLHLGKCSFRH